MSEKKRLQLAEIDEIKSSVAELKHELDKRGALTPEMENIIKEEETSHIRDRIWSYLGV